MPIPLGILAVAGAGAGAAGAYDLLETTVLGTTASDVTFSSLGSYSAYKHLQIRATIKGDNAGSGLSFAFLRFNGDSSSVYANHRLSGNGSSVSSTANVDDSGIWTVGVQFGQGTNIYSGCVIDLLDFSSTSKNKTVRILGGVASSSNSVSLASGFRANTAAITSLTISTPLLTGIASGSRFSLYGIK